MDFRDPSGLFQGDILRHYADLALEEEIVEGGPENPVADVSGLVTLAIGLTLAIAAPDPEPAASGGNGAGNNQPPTAAASDCPPDDPGKSPFDPIDPQLQHYLDGSGGRWGSSDTRALNDWIATELKNQGYRIQGAGRGPEEWIPGPNGGTKGGTYVDITATKAGSPTIRVQTVTTTGGTLNPTPAEVAAGARIRAAFPNDQLILAPK